MIKYALSFVCLIMLASCQKAEQPTLPGSATIPTKSISEAREQEKKNQSAIHDTSFKVSEKVENAELREYLSKIGVDTIVMKTSGLYEVPKGTKNKNELDTILNFLLLKSSIHGQISSVDVGGKTYSFGKDLKITRAGVSSESDIRGLAELILYVNGILSSAPFDESTLSEQAKNVAEYTEVKRAVSKKDNTGLEKIKKILETKRLDIMNGDSDTSNVDKSILDILQTI